MTMAISRVCPKCATIEKSGKFSCCGRDGSWFKNCGGAGNTKLEHTWQDGIRACKARAQFRTGMGKRLDQAEQNSNGFFNIAGMLMNSKLAMMTDSTVASASCNKSTPMPKVFNNASTTSMPTAYDVDMTTSKSTVGAAAAMIIPRSRAESPSITSVHLFNMLTVILVTMC